MTRDSTKKQKRQLPKFWYEAMPALYALAGAASLALLGKPGTLSGAMLLSAAGLTAWWRYDYRQLAALPAEADPLS